MYCSACAFISNDLTMINDCIDYDHTDHFDFCLGLPCAFVTIECTPQWIGVPDVRFEHIATPITNVDPGGGVNGIKQQRRFIDVSIKIHLNNLTHCPLMPF